MDSNTVFMWLGRAFVLYCAYMVTTKFLYLWKLYLAPAAVNFSKYGSWSVVTGATSGIGKAIAFELASKGQNIILISNENLNNVANEIASKHQVETRCLEIDFTDDEHIYNEIKEFLQGYDIGVLVNNVGIAHHPARFLEIPNLENCIKNLTKINVTTLMKMHQIVLPDMVKKQKGVILNLSSASRLRPLVCTSLYGASKRFIDYFSQALSYEYENKGIIIQSLSPFFLKTELTKSLRRHNSFPSAEEWVKNALRTVGKHRSVYGDIRQTFQAFVVRNIPISFIHNWIFKNVDFLNQQKRE